MRQLKAKLRSRRGASITFALLLFLVCAIISTVVVVSASTVGGRASGMRETDQRYFAATAAQRYFAATAAAQTLQGMFYGKSATVTYDPANPTEGATAVCENDYKLLKEASIAVATGKAMGTNPIAISGKLEEGQTASPYTCTVTPDLDNGLLSFDIVASGPAGAANDGKYKLTIVFASNLNKPDANGAASATATVKWSLHSLSKGRAPEPEAEPVTKPQGEEVSP